MFDMKNMYMYNLQQQLLYVLFFCLKSKLKKKVFIKTKKKKHLQSTNKSDRKSSRVRFCMWWGNVCVEIRVIIV